MSPLRPNDKLKPITAKYPWPTVKSLLRTMAALALGYILLLAYLHYQSKAKVARIFGGANGVDIVQHADQVEVYRIEKIPIDPKLPELALSDHPVQKGPVAVSESDARALVTILLDEKSYEWRWVNSCIPQPGVRIDFIRGGDRLSVLLCFECKMLENYRKEKFVGGQSFDYIQPALVRIVRSLFPGDPEIQSLKEEEFGPHFR